MSDHNITLAIDPASDDVLSHRLDAAARMLAAVRRSFGESDFTVSVPAEGQITFQFSDAARSPGLSDETDQSIRGDVAGTADESPAGDVFTDLSAAGHYVEKVLVNGHPVHIIDEHREDPAWLEAIDRAASLLKLTAPRIVEVGAQTPESIVMLSDRAPGGYVVSANPATFHAWAKDAMTLPNAGYLQSIQELEVLQPQELDMFVLHAPQGNIDIALRHTKPGGLIIARLTSPEDAIVELVKPYAEGDARFDAAVPYVLFIRNKVGK
jgi:hypothetical protein